jgi:dihydroorotase
MLTGVVGSTAKVYRRALVMPNLIPAVLTADDALAYRNRILKASPNEAFEPLMTIKLTPGKTNVEHIFEAKRAGIIAGKLYPQGVTTNSEDGWEDIEQLWSIFEAMADCGMVLCLHGELPGIFCLDREKMFVENVLPTISREYPALKIVLEHVTTAVGVRAVTDLPNVAGTITVHHLLLTLDDVIGGMLKPHHFCKPIAKREFDRQALIDAAVGRRRGPFFLGTDSAPHARTAKECRSGCAGVYSAPVALPLLAEIFEREKHLDRLEAFVSEHGARFYGLPLNEGVITLKKEPWIVPDWWKDGVEQVPNYIPVPFYAGREIAWRVSRLCP